MTVPLSIIMTVHNGASHLLPSMTSLLDQTYGEFELIVVDDGSTDHSADIVRSFEDNRLRLIQVGRIGRTAALNRGIDEARGELVAVQDADDISFPQRLESQVTYMESQRHIALLGTWFELVSESGEHIELCKPPTKHDEIVEASVHYNPFAHSSVVYRREIVQSLGGYPKEFVWAQDFALCLIFMRHYRVEMLPSVQVQVRLHSGQMTNDQKLFLTKSFETVKLLRFSASHPHMAGASVSPLLIRAELNYSKSLFRAGRYRDAFASMVRTLLKNPCSCIANLVSGKTSEQLKQVAVNSVSLPT